MITDKIRTAVAKVIADRFKIGDIQPDISRPEPKFGDFATNVAFGLSRQLKRPPQEIASEIAAALPDDDISEATATGGSINITMHNAFWVSQLHAIKPDYGSGTLGKGQKVEVEFISANPTGPTTIGNARGGYIGDTLANVLATQGYAVTREYYFNNAGTQISKLVESVKVSAGLITSDDVLKDVQYKGDYIEELAKEFKADLATKSDDQLAQLLTQAILERWIEPAIAAMGVHFDSWTNERDLVSDGRFAATIRKLKAKGLVFEREGASWLDTGKLGVKRDERVIVKSNGDPTYLGPDIAFHDDLFGPRGFDLSIKVLGADHIDQFPSVKAAVLALYPDKRLEAVVCQWFRLMRDGREVKISKRLGQFVTVEELIQEVGASVARFMTLMRTADTGMDFDLDVAKEQSQKNPLYYVMYSYARAHSILEQASARNLVPISTLSQVSDQELALVRYMTRFPELLQEIAGDYGVHRLTFYGIELAKLFHDLYESERIIDLNKGEACRRLYVIAQYVVFMKRYFEVLGITPVERMDHDA